MIRYAKLGSVEFNVSDLARSREFYRDMVGLQEVGERQDGALLFRCDDDLYSVALHQSSTPGYKRAGWILEDSSQFENLHRQLKLANVPFERLPSDECAQRGFVCATRTADPNSKATLEFFIPLSGTSRHQFEPTHTKIQRLGHVVFNTPQRDRSVAFFRDVLNFKESDSIGERVTFMRPFPNPYHHGVGFAEAVRPSFHHLNLMVTEIDDVGRGIIRLRRHNIPILKGLGRHPASGSIFLYFLDPDGITIEYSFGMEEFAEANPRAARTLPNVPASVDLWEGPIDRSLNLRGEIEVAPIARD
jgi:2,3-dihydroxy-p-cumate/2,3-dihydroxybenzoate 3,4-dioxygenase